MPTSAPVHPINRLLSRLGIRVTRSQPPIPREFMEGYRRALDELKRSPGGFDVHEEMWYETGEHPARYTDFEAAFAASHISRLDPASILDIGSYRLFILGLLANYRVTTLDVRRREPATPSETVVTGDAKDSGLPDGSFDAVVSLCALEHFGLGRYGDEFDPVADRKALAEMVRLLKPGGHLIFTTHITRGRPAIGFNAHRIYSREMLHERCAGLALVEERYYSHALNRYCSLEEVTDAPRVWDVYCGCWQKP
ncbi:MAG: DUF268 domain-containing protein [Nitrospirae bacterium]|nr:DUF268 domain-containing protein [Nitrospirota bacterium]MBI5695642.1 DUF268 domain-containing protein [Nitrospirota bacterium]